MSLDSPKIILQKFDRAASQYNTNGELQKKFALHLAKQCAKQVISSGFWVDLGSGTGLLAEALEKFYPSQSVVRVDASENMLAQMKTNSPSQLWDLNLGLPHWDEKPQLIASSFALHWLVHPESKIKEWFQALNPGGWLAIAVPIDGCFPEWQQAAKVANTRFTAFPLPSRDSLLANFHNSQVKYHAVEVFVQEGATVSSLLKPMSKVGANCSLQPKLKIGDWRKIEKYWPRYNKNKSLKLTWLIQVLIAQK